ncbi:heavy metal-binding domain-containing protein [bacterium]|nr:heavy metal-binding domain-containing protein [bacterium]
MLVTTQDELTGYKITAYLGLARGNTVRCRHLGKDIMAGLRNMVGGEVQEYTKLMAESREQAINRMIAHAQQLGADGVVCLRFTTSSISTNASELFVYGTAVKLQIL